MSISVVTARQPSRFLELPPELRNSIYELATEACSHEDIDLFRPRSGAPEPAITMVSRQVRRESRGIHRTALSKFWSSNVFHIYLDVYDVFHSAEQSFVMRQCYSMPSLGIDTLRFVVGGLDKPGGPDRLIAEAVIDRSVPRPSVTWRKWFAGLPATDVTARFAGIASTYDYTFRYASFPGSVGGLNLACCVSAFFEWVLAGDTVTDIKRWWL